MQLFDRERHLQRREKAATGFSDVDFLVKEAADRLADRLHDIQRDFSLAAEIGCHTGQFSAAAAETGKISRLIQTDISGRMIAQNASTSKLVSDPETLPFAPHSFDAIFSSMALHWVNDLPGCLKQCFHALKADGLFLAVMPGPKTLQELRHAILHASMDSGLTPRISPFVEVRDAGGLLQRAGFALPVIDSETITIRYRDLSKMLQELKSMGENNALLQRHKGMTTANFWKKVEAYYHEHFRDEDGRLHATVELVFMTGWKPHESQQQPAKRGSGQVNLGELFGQ